MFLNLAWRIFESVDFFTLKHGLGFWGPVSIWDLSPPLSWWHFAVPPPVLYVLMLQDCLQVGCSSWIQLSMPVYCLLSCSWLFPSLECSTKIEINIFLELPLFQFCTSVHKMQWIIPERHQPHEEMLIPSFSLAPQSKWSLWASSHIFCLDGSSSHFSPHPAPQISDIFFTST